MRERRGGVGTVKIKKSEKREEKKKKSEMTVEEKR
jgi:hypothetical protein